VTKPNAKVTSFSDEVSSAWLDEVIARAYEIRIRSLRGVLKVCDAGHI
jgi:hypothetical protein